MQTKILNYGLNITPHKANYQAKVSSPDFAMPALRKDAFSKNVNFTALGTATMPIEFLQRGAITRELVHRLHLEEPEKLEILSNEARKLISGDKFVILPQYLDRTLDDMLNFTKTLKNNLDDKYGSGEYVVISIGRSPALTSEMHCTFRQSARSSPGCTVHWYRIGRCPKRPLDSRPLGKCAVD